MIPCNLFLKNQSDIIFPPFEKVRSKLGKFLFLLDEKRKRERKEKYNKTEYFKGIVRYVFQIEIFGSSI